MLRGQARRRGDQGTTRKPATPPLGRVPRVPRNRREIPRDQRLSELVGAATELFLTRGYTGTTMSEVAKGAGVANAALYWYFPTKDHLLSEVMDRALAAELQLLAMRPPGPDPIDHLLQGLVDLRPYRQLHMTMHERLADSEVVVEAHSRLIGWVRGLVQDGLAYHGVSSVDRDEVEELVVVVFEGLNVPGVRARSASEVIRNLLRLVLTTDERAGPGTPASS
jgi:AcrR family transcriptional regulator